MTFLESVQAPAIIGSLVLVPLIVVGGILVLWKRFIRNRNRRSPLTTELLRTPGFGLQERIDVLNDEISVDLMAITSIPLIVFGTYQLHSQTTQTLSPRTSGLIFAATALIVLVFMTVRLIRRLNSRQRYRDALAGELATAQLLEPIIAGGGRVLHDIQAPGFNIDHVVVAPGGVFAVETKHRLKSTQGKGKEQAKVTFDGQALRFPDWTETKPAEQARAQARWLSERLTKSTGLEVKARPVIALPGWFVENTSRSDVIATNPKACQFMLKARAGEASLTPDAIKRISFQVEQLCRMPEPGQATELAASGWKDRRAG